MNLIGYADRFSVRPGEQVDVKVSADVEAFRASLVRLRGPMIGDRTIAPDMLRSNFEGKFPGLRQEIPIGSYMRVDGAPANLIEDGVGLVCWVMPNLPRSGEAQGIFSWLDDEMVPSISIGLDDEGYLGFEAGTARCKTVSPLIFGRWYFVAAGWGRSSGRIALKCQMEQRSWLGSQEIESLQSTGGAAHYPGATLILGARQLVSVGADRYLPMGCFNGKVDRPSLWSRMLSEEEIHALWMQGQPAAETDGLTASWDLASDLGSPTVTDLSGNGLHGTFANHPMRGVTGANWTGAEVCPRLMPEHYGAVAFHPDDLTDCEWTTTFTWEVSSSLTPGVYGIRLEADEVVDHIPVYVRSASDAPTQSILFLAPTNTYLAYANERLFHGLESDPDFIEKTIERDVVLSERDQFLIDHPELGSSVYDRHPDGTGVCYSSRLRPVVTMRPECVSWATGDPRHFSGDLYLIEWLEAMGYDYDVATDEDLHLEGCELLNQYSVVLTGSHPEYWTTPMMIAMDRYLANGGKLMYLGGNGFYWVTGMDHENSAVIEVRRGINGTRAWTSHPGEIYLSTTGELGGLWRNRGRFPNAMVGVGFASQGWGGAPGYRRLPDSFRDDAAFVFDGVGEHDAIGEFGLVMGGAAGDEVDRYDEELGTPPETLRLATTEGSHSDYYQVVIEDCAFMLPGRGGRDDARVRADITLLQDESGGAVFSVGSINWIGSLMWNDAQNNVSTITTNVLSRFAGPSTT